MALADQCIEHVGHRDDPSDLRDLVPLEPLWIAGAVIALMVVLGAVGQIAHGLDRGQNVSADGGVLLDLAVFLVGELSLFFQDQIRNADLAHVVQKSRLVDLLHALLVIAHGLGQSHAVARHTDRVALGDLVLGLDDVDDRKDRLERQFLILPGLFLYLGLEIVMELLELHDARDPAFQHARDNGLGNKIARPHVETGRLFLHALVGREENKGDLFIGVLHADAAHGLLAVHAGHHQIHQDQVRSAA